MEPVFTECPEHADEDRWKCVVEGNGKRGKGRGANKKATKIRASICLLRMLKNKEVDNEPRRRDELFTKKGFRGKQRN